MTRARLRLAAKLAASAVLVLVLIRFVPLAGVARALGSAAALPLAAGLLATPAYLWAGAVHQVLLLRGYGVRLAPGAMFQLNLATGFYSLLLPGTIAGGAYRWYRLSAGGAHPVEALLFIVTSRLLETGALVVLGLAALALARPPGAPQGMVVLLGAALPALGVLVWMVADGRAARRLRARVPAEPRTRLARAAARGLDALIALGTMPRRLVLGMLAALLARHAVEVLGFVLLAQAVGIGVPLLAAVWARSFIVLAVMLPVTIAGVGVRDAALVAALAPYGVPAEQAIALAVLLLARTVLVALAGGASEGHRVLTGGGALPLAPARPCDG